MSLELTHEAAPNVLDGLIGDACGAGKKTKRAGEVDTTFFLHSYIG